MKKALSVLLVLVSVLLISCKAVQEGYDVGKDAAEKEDAVTGKIRTVAEKALGKAEGDDAKGVQEVVFNSETGYVTIKYRMVPVLTDLRLMEQFNQMLYGLIPKLLKVDEVETICVLLMLPTEGDWEKGITAEGKRKVLENVECGWEQLPFHLIPEVMEEYRIEPRLERVMHEE